MSGHPVHWLGPYLRDHYAVAAASVRLFDRVANGHSDQSVRTEVTALGREEREDRSALGSMIGALGVREASLTEVAAVVGEYVGRLKPNGSLLQRSPGSDVLELEALGLVVQMKSRVWETLLALAQDDDRLDTGRLQDLTVRAGTQSDRLTDLHAQFLVRLTSR